MSKANGNKKVGAAYGNKNASGKRVTRDRIRVDLSISEGNGLAALFVEYLSRQGVEPTQAAIAKTAKDWAYQYWEERLKREIETSDAAIIV